MAKPSQSTASRIAAWITLSAFLLAIVLVVLRATTSQTLRDAELMTPGAPAAPRGVGPAQSVALDLACCAPALLVLTRRLLDREYTLRAHWSFMPLALLCAFMAASVMWSSDKFAAAVSASHWIAACAMLWAMSQLVRSWLRLRFVGAVCVALLGILAVRGIYYRFVELPDLIRNWQTMRLDEFHRRGWDPDSFSARQLDTKIRSGEMIGFNVSANSFAGLLVMLGIVGAGVIIQRVRESDSAANGGVSIVLTGAVLVVGTLVLILTRCKAAIATPILAAGLLGMLALWRRQLAARAKMAFYIGVAIVLAAMAAVVGHGLAHDTLPSISLAFRWDYWVGALRVFVHHALLGVGWSNFSRYYLQYRLPRASEEILDPHCFIVRFFTELGVVGGALILAWMLMLWWELTRPLLPPVRAAANGDAAEGTPEAGDAHQTARHESAGHHATSGGRSAAVTGSRRVAARGSRPSQLDAQPAPLPSSIKWALFLGVAWFVLSLAATIDWSQNIDYVFLELMGRAQYLAILVVITAVVALRSLQPPADDPRPAPWILYAFIIAAAMLLIHNLVDFSMFETGILLTFVLLVGSALGIRGDGRDARAANPAASVIDSPTSASATSPPRRHTPAVAVAFAAGLIGWLIAAGFFLLPLASAEAAANRSDDLLREKHAADAERLMVEAREDEPLNADYAYRAARIAIMEDKPAEAVRPMLKIAIERDPRNPSYYLTMAHLEARNLEKNTGGLSAQQREQIARWVRENFDRALQLDPHNIQARLEYARWLASIRDAAAAKQQFTEARRFNDLLRADDTRRLSRAELEKIQAEEKGL